jgi:hypothetical protein
MITKVQLSKIQNILDAKGIHTHIQPHDKKQNVYFVELNYEIVTNGSLRYCRAYVLDILLKNL